MPSPFPGMDPYIDGQEWDDFHPLFIGVVREVLTAQLRPRYVVRVERRVYVEHGATDETSFVRPDVSVFSLPRPAAEERRETFLTVREAESRAVVTVLEVLSPGNKRRGSDGRREYLNKREAVLQSSSHLVELDLLRGGARLPTIERLPSKADFYAFVCRQQRRWEAEVFAWTLRDALPAIPIPLADDDADTALDLQAALTTTYDRAGYDYSLDYQRELAPPLSSAAAQ